MFAFPIITVRSSWHIEERWETPLAEAKQLLTTWLENNPEIIDRLRREYQAIKEEWPPQTLNQLEASASRSSRNLPSFGAINLNPHSATAAESKKQRISS